MPLLQVMILTVFVGVAIHVLEKAVPQFFFDAHHVLQAY